MSEYTDHIAIEPFREPNGSWKWELTAELRWEIGKLGSGLFVTVPSGFVTDLATIPRLARLVFNPYDPSTAKAALIHDQLLDWKFGQQMAAGEFYAAMQADKVPLARRKLYYYSVLWAVDVW